MKKGILIDLCGGRDKTLEERFELAAKAGFDGVELSVNEGDRIDLSTGENEIKKIADAARTCGLKVHSVTGGTFFKYSFSSQNQESREMALRYAKKQIDTAKICGADTILLVPGMVDSSIAGRNEIIPYDIAYDNALAGMKELIPYAESAGITIGIENVWNKFLLSPLEMRQFIDDCKSDYVGAYLDVGNVLQTGFPEHWIRILGTRVKKVHVKDFLTSVGNICAFVPLLSGNVNFPEIMKALGEIGYDKWLTAEVRQFLYCPEATVYQISQAMDFIKEMA